MGTKVQHGIGLEVFAQITVESAEGVRLGERKMTPVEITVLRAD
jgi:hypothetical protein